jgi:hypothetical protein
MVCRIGLLAQLFELLVGPTVSLSWFPIRRPAMRDRPQTLPVSCPHCNDMLAEITALSPTVVTLTCMACGHDWPISMGWLPDNLLTILGGTA